MTSHFTIHVDGLILYHCSGWSEMHQMTGYEAQILMFNMNTIAQYYSCLIAVLASPAASLGHSQPLVIPS